VVLLVVVFVAVAHVESSNVDVRSGDSVENRHVAVDRSGSVTAAGAANCEVAARLPTLVVRIGTAAPFQVTAVNVGGSALFAKFSRQDESEADAEGVKITVQAGINPNGIPDMFRLLLAERQRNPNALEAFFATHPLEQDRIASTEALIATYPASQIRGLRTDATAFQSFKRRLQSMPQR